MLPANFLIDLLVLVITMKCMKVQEIKENAKVVILRGCILICKDGEKLLEKAYGYADLPNKIPNEVDTKFATASAGKAFVAVGILQLIEKGLLTLNDKIGDIFDFDLKAIDDEITVEELLTHTSGIPDYFDECGFIITLNSIPIGFIC